jgi:hypothetical protein
MGLYPLVKKAWNKIGISTKLILISNEIPSVLESFKDEIVLFHPIENIHTAFQAQCIRLLYPSLFDNQNIIISDMDIIPLKKSYFQIENHNEKFIIFRNAYTQNQMYAMCYNLANSATWKQIFLINSLQDIVDRLKSWYNSSYNGIKNCPGWYTDQKMLFKYVNDYNKNIIILDDNETKFKRLDKNSKTKLYILNNLDEVCQNINSSTYTDFHVIRPFHRYIKIIERIIRSINI